MNFRPLCTANVWPIISGTIVDRLHLVQQVTVDERAFLDRTRHLVFSLSPHDDVLVRALVVTGLVALRRLPPGRLRMIALRAALAAAVRMVDRIHRHAADA